MMLRPAHLSLLPPSAANDDAAASVNDAAASVDDTAVAAEEPLMTLLSTTQLARQIQRSRSMDATTTTTQTSDVSTTGELLFSFDHHVRY